MKPRVVVLGIALLLALGVFVWFWLLASVPRVEAQSLTLHIEEGSVLVKSRGDGGYRAAEQGMVLQPGDTVKTEAGGRAVVQFFGMAESRLDERTELVVAEASQNAEVADSLQVKLELGTGRVWSRVLRLFDLDSGFEVETSAVVATVRGTAFDVGYGEDGVTRIWVAESAVGVLPEGTQDPAAVLAQLRDAREALAATTGTVIFATRNEAALGALPAGEMAHYDAQGTPLLHRPLSDEDRATVWFQENTAQDDAFMTNVETRRREELAALGGARPDQWNVGITVLSEQFHLAIAGEETRDERSEQYLVRRLARLVDLVERGKSGLASQEFARLEQDIRNQLRDDADGKMRGRARSALVQVARLLDQVDTRSSLYPFKQRMEDLLLALQEGDEAAMLFTRLVAVDARIDEAGRLIEEEAREDARVALDAARGGIHNVRRDAEPVLPTLTAARQEAVIGKVLALIAREMAERTRLEQVQLQPEESASSTVPVVPAATSTPPLPTAPVVTTPTPEFTGIRLAVGTGALTVGSPVTMDARADRIDGTSADISAKSTFRIVSGNGTLNGMQFIPTAAGTTVIEASYNDQGVMRTVQASVTVVGQAMVQFVALSPTASSIKSGESVSFRATATYADGSTVDVTSSVLWSFAPIGNGRFSGNIFTGIRTASTSTAPSPVAVTVQGSYTENGVTRIGTSSVTVN